MAVIHRDRVVSDRDVGNQVGRPVLERSREVEKAHPIEEVGRRMRNLMNGIREAKKDSSDPRSR